VGILYGLLTLQKMIKAGETLREQGVRRKPVLSELPKGVTLADLKAEVQAILEQEGQVDVHKLDASLERPLAI
jgi:hypothetical protein